MSDTFEWDVFLSHSSVDKPRVARLADRLAERLAERLSELGLKVWFDREDIDDGQDIVERVLASAESSGSSPAKAQPQQLRNQCGAWPTK